MKVNRIEGCLRVNQIASAPKLNNNEIREIWPLFHGIKLKVQQVQRYLFWDIILTVEEIGQRHDFTIHSFRCAAFSKIKDVHDRIFLLIFFQSWRAHNLRTCVFVLAPGIWKWVRWGRCLLDELAAAWLKTESNFCFAPSNYQGRW